MRTQTARSEQRSAWLTDNGLSWLAAAVTIISWASAFAGIRVGLEGYSPYSLALLRYAVASVLLVGFVFWRRIPLPDWQDVPRLALLGFFGFTLYNVALNAGEVGVTAGTASFLIGSAPVFIALGAVVFLGERLTWWGWFGSAVSFSGVAVISLLTQEGGEAAGLQLNGWALLVVIAAGAGATYSVSMKPMLKKYGALRTTTYAIWTGTLLLLIYLPGLLADAQTAPMDATLAVIYMGVIPGAIGYVCWSYVLSKIQTSVAGSLLYLIPLLATLIAWVWLGEVPGAATFVGGVLIIAGVVVVNRLGRHRPQPR